MSTRTPHIAPHPMTDDEFDAAVRAHSARRLACINGKTGQDLAIALLDMFDGSIEHAVRIYESLEDIGRRAEANRELISYESLILRKMQMPEGSDPAATCSDAEYAHCLKIGRLIG